MSQTTTTTTTNGAPTPATQPTNLPVQYRPRDAAEPLVLHLARAPSSSTMRCTRAPGGVPFFEIRQTGGRTAFTHAATREAWAQITHCGELGGAVLDAPALGLLQLPLSTYCDDMTALFPRSGGAFSMRTRYGCQKWFRARGKAGAVVVRAAYPAQDGSCAESVVSALTLTAREVSTPANVYQPPNFLPRDADPNLFAKWPFSFKISAVYRSQDDFTLEITLTDLPSSHVLVREASVHLIHAAVLAAFTINQSIWDYQEPQ